MTLSGAISSRLCLLTCLLFAATAPWPAAGGDARVGHILMTSAELRKAGLSLGNKFPNTCGEAALFSLSISDKMLRHFERRGFTLESLCLGLSGMARFDMETGRQLPVALVHGQTAVLLNLPDCFAGGKPLHDCAYLYDSNIPFKLEADDKDGHAESMAELGAKVRAYIRRRGAAGKVTTDELGGMVTSAIEYFWASPALPDGYGYALHGGEGDDPEAEINDVDLATYRKTPNLWSLWFEE